MKPTTKSKTEKIEEEINEKTIVKVSGPYENPDHLDWGRSLFIKTEKQKAYINEKNCLHNLKEDYELKEIKSEENELGTIVDDISRIKWKPLEENRSYSKPVSMIETNTILKDILEKMTEMVDIFDKAKKKKGD